MPLIKAEYPIMEYDTAEYGVVRSGRNPNKERLPSKCLLLFFSEVLKDIIDDSTAYVAHRFQSEKGQYPIFVDEVEGQRIVIAQAHVGSPNIAMLLDYLISYDVDTIVACGGCGVLRDIPVGDVLLPTAALRDEGASYSYLPPSRWIDLDEAVLSSMEATLVTEGEKVDRVKAWTTDAFYRETADMVAYRREEGCDVVEMECATMAAVAKFYGARFGQLLYSGDTLSDVEGYDDRDWMHNWDARHRLTFLARKALLAL